VGTTTKTQSNKTISVIVPAYNYAHYLKECVESIVNQTHRVDEIIIVDDGSLDNTKEVANSLIERFADHNIKLITKKNGGLSSARNTGIRESTSEFIMCLDADDIIPPDSLQLHLDNAKQKVISQCGLQEFDARDRMYWPQGATLHSMTCGNTVYCNAVFPKKIWELVGGYDESETMRLGYEDWEYFIRCIDRGCKVVTRNEIGLLYRIHADSMTRTTTHKNHSLLVDYIKTKNKSIFEAF